MSPDKDAALCAKYPKIFRDRNAPMNQTAMCWGFECGDGWYDIVDALCGNIQNHVDWLLSQQTYKVKRGEIKLEDVQSDDRFQIVATQVKEKFGGLRFYTNFTDPTVDGMISMAESMSYRTCEVCGGPGRPNKEGWISTMCDTCRAARDKRRAEEVTAYAARKKK